MLCLLWIDVVHIFDLGHKSDFRAEDSLKLAETAWSKLEWNKACYVCNGFIFEFGHKSDHRAEDSLKLAEPFRSKLEWNQACYALCEFMLSTSFNLATKVTIVLKIVWNLLNLFEASLNGIRQVMLYVNSCCPHLLIGPQKWQSCWR